MKNENLNWKNSSGRRKTEKEIKHTCTNIILELHSRKSISPFECLST
jgi:hypothetical protein